MEIGEWSCTPDHVALDEPPTPEEWAPISKRHGGKMFAVVIDDWQTSDCTKKRRATLECC